MKNTKVFAAALVVLLRLMMGTMEAKAQSTIVSFVGEKDGFRIGDIRLFTADVTDPVGTDFLLFTAVTAPVEIDIKPGSDPNSIQRYANSYLIQNALH